jgi:hypothetical protein
VQQSKKFVEGVDLGALSDSDLLYMHEKRNWMADDRSVQSIVKSIRGEYYFRYVMCMHSQKMYIVADKFSPAKLKRYKARRFDCVNNALDCALKNNPDADILVIPEGINTFPIVDYSFAK